jgi:glycosyltransferase involved in cell wall biosynthesis
MTSRPLVSVIVPTRNSEQFLEACLRSIRAQSYPNVEVIVVDNHSTDSTPGIAVRFADQVLVWGPERSAQVNAGARRALGYFLYKVDSDFVLDTAVIEQCVDKALAGFDAVVVHNSPDTRAGWIGRIRKFEVDMYKYDLAHSSARFVRKDIFDCLGGFDETITAGEDYDFQNRLNDAGYRTGFVDAEALHLGEPTKLLPHLRKYHQYGREFAAFTERNPPKQLHFLRRVYLRNWRVFLAHPMRGLGFAIYNVLKYSAGGSGYLREKAARALAARNADRS